MPPEAALDLIREALLAAAITAAPVLAIVGLASLATAVLQGVSGMHDPTLALLPRLLAGGIAIICLLPWMLERVIDFAAAVYRGGGAG